MNEPCLIAPDEGSPVTVENPNGSGNILLICEHASHQVPRSLNDLGLDQNVLKSHVAWDPGAAAVAKLMAAELDAPLVLQSFSRLVYDCNRPPDAGSAMPAKSEVFDIPGNANLTEQARQQRIDAIYQPFREKTAERLDHGMRLGKMPAVVTIHSFTPVFFGQPRQVEIGLLHDSDRALADAMLDAAADWTDLEIRRNQPYGPKDGVTHTLKINAIARGLPNVMIEIRNDLIQTKSQQSDMATRLAALVIEGLGRLSLNDEPHAERVTD